MDFTGEIAKINPFFIIFTEISPYFGAENVPHFRKNLVRACGPLGHLRVANKIRHRCVVSKETHTNAPQSEHVQQVKGKVYVFKSSASGL
jgi:hypothetical protein